MKRSIWRILAVLAACTMLLCCLPSCGEDNTQGDSTSNGPVEQGSEEELTAVRQELIKATETKGLGDITKMEFFENGVRTTSDKYVQAKDNKKIYYADDIKRVVNYPDGYILDMPQDWVPDYSLSTLRVRYESDAVTMIASDESDGFRRYDSIETYLTTLYNVVSNEDFQKNNKVSVVEDFKTVEIDEKFKAQVYRVKLEGCEEGTKCYYTYVDYYDGVKNCIHMMFKAIDDRDLSDVYMSFQSIVKKGAPLDCITYPCANNPNWNEETTAYYEALREQDTVTWGLFGSKLETTGWSTSIPMMEKKMDFTFPVISQYYHYSSEGNVKDVNMSFVNSVLEDGRMMQVTYQYTDNNNGDQTAYNPTLDIYRGTDKSKETLTHFAEQVASIGKPFFFRLNNEMNTDWTSYCGMANMLDPDIFVDTWVRLYDIFTETGANQYAMWIFNGFDGSYPPFNWCNYRCYMPDVQYIDLIGLTGYNGVSPEEEAAGEGTWRSFTTIYDGICNDIDKNYSGFFGEWPWIISEFGCEGKDESPRAEWITEMFDDFASDMYPNIKVAIWFSCNDVTDDGEISNKFNLDGDTESLKAFKEGLELTQ